MAATTPTALAWRPELASVDNVLLVHSAAVAFALLPFQNSLLQATPLGAFGAALSVLPLAAFGFCWLLCAVGRSDEVAFSAAAVAIGIYVGVVTLYGFWAFDWVYRGIPLLNKAALAGVQWLFFGLALAAGALCPQHLARRGLAAAWLINLAGIAIGGGLRGAGDSHAVGFSSEPSHFGLLTAMVGLTLAALLTRRTSRIIVLGISLAVILLSDSKGAVAVLGIVVVVAGIVRNRRDWGRLLLAAPLVVAGAGALFAVTISRIRIDLEAFTSTVTRLSGFLTGFLVAIDHPFGVGLGGFFPAFAETVPRTWPLIQSVLGSKVNFAELFQLAFGDDRAVSTKNFLCDTMIYFGWPGALLLVGAAGVVTWRSLSSDRPGGLWLGMALAFGLFAFCTYNTVIPLYVVPMIFGFAWREHRRP